MQLLALVLMFVFAAVTAISGASAARRDAPVPVRIRRRPDAR